MLHKKDKKEQKQKKEHIGMLSYYLPTELTRILWGPWGPESPRQKWLQCFM